MTAPRPPLDRERLTNYPRLILVIYAVALAGFWLSGPGSLDAAGSNIGADFLTFYAGSAAALAGDAAQVWDPEAMQPVQQALAGAPVEPYPFHYPPSFLLLCLPLAWLPYLAAFALWCALGLTAYTAFAKRAVDDPMVPALALAFPGCFQNVVQGQNGLFTTTLLGVALWRVRERPALAGAALGLLSFKPHLATVGFLALALGRHWTALGVAAGVAGALAGASALALGPEVWTAFADNAPFALQILETEGELPWGRMPTVQVSAMLLGLPVAVARGVQTAAAVGACLALAGIWLRSDDAVARVLSVVGAVFLVTPFGFDYDLALLALPALALGRAVLDGEERPGDRPLIAVLWLAPLILPAIGTLSGVQLGPVLWVWLLAVAWRRSG